MGTRGLSLVEVVVTIGLLALISTLATRAATEVARAAALGRRWTALAAAAEAEAVRLRRDYRLGRPACVPPPGGSRVTAEGIAVDWWVVGDSVTAAITVAIRGRAAGRLLADSILTRVSCR